MKTAVNKDNVQKQPLGVFLLLKTFTKNSKENAYVGVSF